MTRENNLSPQEIKVYEDSRHRSDFEMLNRGRAEFTGEKLEKLEVSESKIDDIRAEHELDEVDNLYRDARALLAQALDRLQKLSKQKLPAQEHLESTHVERRVNKKIEDMQIILEAMRQNYHRF